MNTVVGLEPDRFFEVMSTSPALLAGLGAHGRLEVGAAANVVVFEPEAKTDTVGTVSRSSNSPYLGLELKGAPVLTVFQGRITMRNGSVVEAAGASG